MRNYRTLPPPSWQAGINDVARRVERSAPRTPCVEGARRSEPAAVRDGGTGAITGRLHAERRRILVPHPHERGHGRRHEGPADEDPRARLPAEGVLNVLGVLLLRDRGIP